MNIGQPINSPCENGKCTSLHDEVYGAVHSRCEKHKKMFDTLSQSKKEHNEMNCCDCIHKDIIERVRAADRDALVRAVEGLRLEPEKLFGTGYNAALDDVLALLHSPEKK